MTTPQDPFSHARPEPSDAAAGDIADGDAAIATLFREWQRQCQASAAAPEDEDDDPATLRVTEIEREIFAMPCGAGGNAVKLYLLAQNCLYSGPGGKLYGPGEQGIAGYDVEGCLNLEYGGFRVLLRDAVRQVPELLPLVVDVINAPLWRREGAAARHGEARAPAGAAADRGLSPDETAFLDCWRRLDSTTQADFGCVLRLPPDDRSAVFRLLDRAIAKAGQATGEALLDEPPAGAPAPTP